MKNEDKFPSTMSSKNIQDGRKVKGESGKTDCVVRAIATAFEVDYKDAHEFVEKNFDRKKNHGTRNTINVIDNMIDKRKSFKGKAFKKIKPETYTNLYGRNLRKSTVFRFAEKNPEGVFILQKRSHLFVVRDGKILDDTKKLSKINKAWAVK